ncbi:hypothetical protein Bhyg_07792 [Pseudolycoriella hygida]|uniref:Uncharacterized protein n=1 Tax=Pseudolycoriella hygida TaxID=35572 RepID=A0A9Q0S3P7_9DIPT|nr:hypothetical protein Bhyg_07792 [Pseudolycoriella hygida]
MKPVKKKLWHAFSIRVGEVKHGSGTSLNGNTARTCFKDPLKVANVLGINADLQTRQVMTSSAEKCSSFDLISLDIDVHVTNENRENKHKWTMLRFDCENCSYIKQVAEMAESEVSVTLLSSFGENFFSELEKSLKTKIPSLIKNILVLMDIDRSVILSEFDNDSITHIEQYMKFEFKENDKIKADDELKDYLENLTLLFRVDKKDTKENHYFYRTMDNFLNENKIENVNIKFVTSILNETIKRLGLLQFEDFASKADENKKFVADVENLKNTFAEVINNLKHLHTFEDFSGISVAEKEFNSLSEYFLNKRKLMGIETVLLKLEKDIINSQKPAKNVDKRFIVTWEKARRDQNSHFCRIYVDCVWNELKEYLKKLKSEEDRILSIENFNSSEKETNAAETIHWSQMFYDDLNKAEIDIQVANTKLKRMKIDYQKIVEEIEYRDQAMTKHVAFKAERNLQKENESLKLIINKYKDHFDVLNL